MRQQKRILNLEEIKLLVDRFYNKVHEDELLAPIFNKVIGNNWAEHLEKMYRFWQTVLLGEHTYYGSPFAPDAYLPVSKKHFDRWLSLFYRILDEHFSGEKADEAKWRAEKMAQMFQHKIDYYKNNDVRPIL